MYRNDRANRAGFWHGGFLSHRVKGNSGTSKNKATSLWDFVPNSGLRKFRHGKSVALSTKLGRACGLHLRQSTSSCWTHIAYRSLVDFDCDLLTPLAYFDLFSICCTTCSYSCATRVYAVRELQFSSVHVTWTQFNGRSERLFTC